MIVGILASLVSLAIPVVLIVLAVRHFSGRSGRGAIDGRSVRRFFQYVLLYALLIVATVGVAELLGLLVRPPTLVGDRGSDLARALTFTIFGIPIYTFLAVWSRRLMQRDPDEAGSLGWAFYVTFAPLTALVVAMFALQEVLADLLSGRPTAWPVAIRFVVWAAVWLVHLRLAARALDATRRQGHLLLGSVIGLGTSVAGLVWLLGESVTALVIDESGTTLLLREQHPLAAAAATLLVGAPVWVVYWARGLARADRTPLWFGYVLPVAVGGSLLLAIAGATTALYQTLVWVLGDPSSDDAARHFAGVPFSAAGVVVGVVVWWYHRQVLASASPERTEVTRIYEYLIAAIALVAAAVGVAWLVAALVEAVLPLPAIGVGASPVNSLLSAVTLLVVGGPLWWVFWSRIERAARAGDPSELSSPTRRIYLFVLFGVGGVTAVISVLVAAFLGIQGLLEDGITAQVLRDMRIPVAILLATGAISGYHWVVYREDRSRLPAAQPAHGPRYVLLLGAPDVGGVRHAVERLTGARVDLWVRTDALAAPWVVEDVVAAVRAPGAESVAVVAGPSGLEAIGLHRP